MAARRYAQIEITQEEYDAVFASDDDSDSNLSFSDVNVDADLSDIEVQEFSEEESGESESEDSESESDESTASDEPEWSRDLHAFDIEPFSGSHGLKVPVPVEAKACGRNKPLCKTKVGSISSKGHKVDRRKQTRIEGLFWLLYYHGNQYLATNCHELVLQSLYWQYRSSGDYDQESLRGNQPIYAF